MVLFSLTVFCILAFGEVVSEPCDAPKYVFVFSTGHCGTTSMANKKNYRDSGGCRVGDYQFHFEEFEKPLRQGRGGPGKNLILAKWYNQTLKMGETMADRQTEIFKGRYSKTYKSFKRHVTTGHDILMFYEGVLRVLPHDRLLFVYIDRSEEEIVNSFRNNFEFDFFKYRGTDPGVINNVSQHQWEQFQDDDKAKWFRKEVRSRFERLRVDYPDVKTLDLHWSKSEGSESYRNMITAFSRAIGLQLTNGTIDHLKRHTTRKRRR